MTASRPPRIAVAGNQWITRYLVEKLVVADLAPSLIINMGDHWADRISGYEDHAQLAQDIGADIYRPEKYNLKSEADEIALCAMDIDVLFVFGWQRLIPEWLIDHCSVGAFGVHGGPERPPRCRGRAVFNWALLLGYERFYMYIFRLSALADDGEIYALREFDICPEDDILTLYHKNCVVTSRMLVETLPGLLAGTIKGQPQTDEGTTFLPQRKPENGGVDWTQSAKRVVDLVRAVAPPYPGAFTYFGETQIYIERAQVFDSKILYSADPGEIVEVFPNGDIVVQAGNGAVYVRQMRIDNNITLCVSDRLRQTSGEILPDPEI